MEGIRLQKVIAEAGVASRRAAEEMIRTGRVQVNGRIVVEQGLRVDPEQDEIKVDGTILSRPESKVYLLFYKPGGCVTTVSDPQGRRTVLDLIDGVDARVFPVGRLDYDAEGLLVLTNDGFLANRLQHPRYGVPKIYEVKVKGRPDERALARLRQGVVLEEGRTAPAEVSVLRLLPKAAWLRIVLHQGWNRQIKRMGEAVGYPVSKIRRVGYGPLEPGELKPGAFRPLTPREVRKLYEIAQQERGIG
jgi:23S rRNA pseudouridine2605 synthase